MAGFDGGGGDRLARRSTADRCQDAGASSPCTPGRNAPRRRATNDRGSRLPNSIGDSLLQTRPVARRPRDLTGPSPARLSPARPGVRARLRPAPRSRPRPGPARPSRRRQGVPYSLCNFGPPAPRLHRNPGRRPPTASTRPAHFDSTRTTATPDTIAGDDAPDPCRDVPAGGGRRSARRPPGTGPAATARPSPSESCTLRGSYHENARRTPTSDPRPVGPVPVLAAAGAGARARRPAAAASSSASGPTRTSRRRSSRRAATRAGGSTCSRSSRRRCRGSPTPTTPTAPPPRPTTTRPRRSRRCRSGPTTGCSSRPRGPATSTCSRPGSGSGPYRPDGRRPPRRRRAAAAEAAAAGRRLPPCPASAPCRRPPAEAAAPPGPGGEFRDGRRAVVADSRTGPDPPPRPTPPAARPGRAGGPQARARTAEGPRGDARRLPGRPGCPCRSRRPAASRAPRRPRRPVARHHDAADRHGPRPRRRRLRPVRPGQPAARPDPRAVPRRRGDGLRAGRASSSPGAIDFDEAEAAGLPRDSQPYVITMEQAFTLALINSRVYQFQLENLYLARLAVTLQRFAFSPQFFAGLSPLTGGGPGGGRARRRRSRRRSRPTRSSTRPARPAPRSRP